MLKREISLKVICEKVKFSNCDFCKYFRDNEWTYIYIINDIRGQMGIRYYSENCILILYQSKD